MQARKWHRKICSKIRSGLKLPRKEKIIGQQKEILINGAAAVFS